MSVTPAIPASQIVSVTPSVLSAGGTALDLNGLILTENTRPPMGQVLSFPTAAAVSTFFGATSQEAALATIYFLGFDNSNKKPGALLFAQYAGAAVSAYVRGGNISAMTLTQLQALNGTLSVTIDSVLKSASINLSSATSFSNAAEIIAGALGIEGVQAATFTGAISGTTLTVSAVSTGTIGVGDVISGAGVTAGTYISALGTGTGGTGTYTVSVSQTVASEALTAFTPAVQYDSVSGAFVILSGTTGATSTITYGSGALAASLLLTQATGAVLSQGAAADTPAGRMNAIIAVTTDWASFMTAWEPVDADKEAFALWNNGQGNRYVYELWDTSVSDTEANGPSAPIAAIQAANYSGTDLIYENPAIDAFGGEMAAFQMGCTASIDFTETNGRIDFADKTQSGLVPHVTDATVAGYLGGYSINFLGDYTTANEAFILWRRGFISGLFKWKDSYVNQIWLANQFQLALMVLLTQVKSLPYNRAGYTLIEAACMDVIAQGLNFGAIRPGVTLSAAQAAEVNSAAGVKIDAILSTRGWYLQVQDASPQVRAARGSPPCTFWYMDGGSVQVINLASVEVQ